MIHTGSVAELFARLEEKEQLLRIDPAVQPSTYRCAVVSKPELAQLQRVTDIVRLGRLQAIEPTRLVLDKGSVDADPHTPYVDCSASASAIVVPPALPVFDVNGMAVMSRGVAPDDTARMALLQDMSAKSGPAAAKLQALLAGAS